MTVVYFCYHLGSGVCADRKLTWASDVQGQISAWPNLLLLVRGKFPGWGWGEESFSERRAAVRHAADITPWDSLKGAESFRIELTVVTQIGQLEPISMPVHEVNLEGS